LDGLYKICCMQQGFMRTSIKPRKSTTKFFY